MKVWLDDCRPMPKGYDLHVKTVEEAINVLKTGMVEEMSFDHDLDSLVETGYHVAVWVEKAAAEGSLKPFVWHVHSANVVGAMRIKKALEKANEYWRENDE